MKKIVLISIAIFMLNLVLKSFLISSIPPILTNDETYYATEAQAFLRSGSDITGRWHPWDLAPANPIYSELTGVTYSPGFLLFPNHTQKAMKVVPILFGSLLPILLGLIVYKLFKEKIFFVTTAVLATFNPWIFQFSRMSFDSLASLFFYCLGITAILYLKGWKILLALIPLTLGFFQYQGHKPLIVPLVLLTVLYGFFSQEKNLSFSKATILLWRVYLPHILVIICSVLLVVVYVLRLPNLSSSDRMSEFTIDKTAVSDQVGVDRQLSLANPLSSLFENKFTVVLEQLSGRFFASYDIVWLFQHGNDRVDTFAVTQFGYLYGLDALCILIALVGLWSHKKWRLAACFLTGFVILGVIPNILKNEEIWLTFRGSFMILGLLLFASVGSSLILLRDRKILTYGLVLFYVLSITPFLYHYFFRYPLLTTKDTFFYNRVMASYIKRQPNENFLLFSDKTLFDSVLAYNTLITKENLPSLHSAYTSEQYILNNFRIANGCFDPKFAATQSGTVVVDYRIEPCPLSDSQKIATPSGENYHMAISSVFDSSKRFLLYNDRLCEAYSLRSFINIEKNVLNVEKLSDQEFCESFFTKSNANT